MSELHYNQLYPISNVGINLSDIKYHSFYYNSNFLNNIYYVSIGDIDYTISFQSIYELVC